MKHVLVTVITAANHIPNTVFALLISIGLAEHQDPLPQPDLEVVPSLIHNQDPLQPDLGLDHHQGHIQDTGLHHLNNQKQNIILTLMIPKFHLNIYMKLISKIVMTMTIRLRIKTMTIIHHTSVTFMMTFMTTTNHTYRKTHSIPVFIQMRL